MRYITVYKTLAGTVVWGRHTKKGEFPLPSEDKIKSYSTYRIEGEGPVYVDTQGIVQTELPCVCISGMVRG